MITISGHALPPEQEATLLRLAALPERTLRALLDLAEQQIALEDAGALPRKVPAVGVFEGGELRYPTACQTRIQLTLAGKQSADLPTCSWSRRGSLFMCSLCCDSIGPDEARYDALSALFPSEDEPS